MPRSLTLLAVSLLAAEMAAGQLQNASFEDLGAGSTFAQWSDFGNVVAADDLVHAGARSAKVWGPFIGTWAISALFQDIPAAPGEVFVAGAAVAHPSGDPLTGDARAIINVEWHDAGGGMISYESFDALTAADPTNVFQAVEFTTGPAPSGTAVARLLLGVLQSPAQESGSVRFDSASISADDAAAHEALQWTDFTDRTIDFAGYTWRCKGDGWFGPGANWFASGPENAWVDAQGRLHLRVTEVGGVWHCAELALEDVLGPGDYRFVTEGRVDELDPNLIFGLFLWEYQESYDGSWAWNVANEFDIEFSRWGNPANPNNAQFVAQPWSPPGNLSGFNLVLAGPDDRSSHAFQWRPDRVVCRSWLGDAPEPTAATLAHGFLYTGPDVPRDEIPRVHLNLWLLNGAAPTDGQEREVILRDFVFTPLPACPGDLDGDGDTDVFDFAELAAGFGAAGLPPLTGGDLDGDGAVTVFDFATLAADFGCATPSRRR